MTALALFDFDGTITTRDTMFAFCRHVAGTPRFLVGLMWLSPTLVGYVLKLVPNDRAKVAMLTHFLGGMKQADLDAAAAAFLPAVERWVRPAARERIEWHKAEGHRVYLVSASLDIWLQPWAEQQGLTLVCTQGRFVDGRFTGELGTPNCHGAEKVRRLREHEDTDSYDTIYAYGDSSGDTEMLAVASKPSYRPFR